jgi:hypothetical protein
MPNETYASPIACNEVNVTWKKPHSTGGLPVDVYEILYKDVSSSKLQNKTSITTSTILNDLSPNTIYRIQVRAKNFIGFGSNTSAEMVMTHSRSE